MNDIFQGIEYLLSSIDDRMKERKKCASIRQKYLSPSPLTKQAFDNRYLDQQNAVNPRRNLQYYQRSESFTDNETMRKVNHFFKIKAAADEIRNKYIGEPDWLDSYTRILCNALDQTLRIETQDMNYSTGQVKYLSELLDVRYRLREIDIEKASQSDLASTILNKDEKLVRLALMKNYHNPFQKNNALGINIHAAPEFMKVAPQPIQQDLLMEKLFGSTKANSNAKNVKRSVNITITDSILDDPEDEMGKGEEKKGT